MCIPGLLLAESPPGALLVIAELALLVAISEFLAQRTFLRHLGSALLVIVLTAIAANLPALPVPVYGQDGGLYDEIFGTVAPLGVFWLLLGVDLRRVLGAGRDILVVFAAGATGVFLGVGLAMAAIHGADRFGEYAAALGGMFVGTYVGGSANFNAVALEYGIPQNAPTLYAGATVVDAAATTVWMILGVAIPRWLARHEPEAESAPATPTTEELASADAETVTPLELAAVLALGGFALLASGAASTWLSETTGLRVASMLVLSTLALLLAQLPIVQRLRGPRALGMLSVLVFLAVIGALCDVKALIALAELGPPLVAFVALALLVHGFVTFMTARLLRIHPVVAAVASQACVGGGTSALALARSLGRSDLVLPAILIGSLGTALGNFLGFGMASWLGS